MTTEQKAQFVAALYAGEKLATAGAAVGLTDSHACVLARDLGLRRTWLSLAEIAQLAEIRAGRALVVRADAAPAAVRLAQQIEAALTEYSSAS